MYKTVTLNEAEQRLARFIAAKRRQENRKNNIVEENRGNYIGIENDIAGIGGELAYCKLFNCFPDTCTTSWDHKDTINNGFTIDVKTTKYASGKLIAPYWKGNKKLPDYYALMIGTFPCFTFYGHIKSEDFINEKHLGDLGYGKTYVAHQSELSMEKLDARIPTSSK